MPSRLTVFSIVSFAAIGMAFTSNLVDAQTADVTTEKKTADIKTPAAPDKLRVISELCASAKDKFTPVDQTDLSAAKQNLLNQIDTLEKRLDQDGGNGKAWKAFVRLGELKKLIDADGKPPESKLAKIQERFDSDKQGLNLIWFAQVRRALWRYRTVSAAIGDPKVKAGYEGLLGQLSTHLEQYTNEPTAALADKLGDVIAWIETIDQAEKIVALVRDKYRQPNLFLDASQKLVARGMIRDIDETGPETDCILGMYINSQAHTTGTVTAELIPNGKEAVIRMVMSGRTNSDNTGSRGVVRVYSESVTDFEAEKLFFVNDEIITSTPATCRAVNRSTIKSVCATNGMRIIEKIARNQVRKNKCRGEQIGARHAEERIARRFDEQSGQFLAEANQSYVDRFRHPLWQRGLFPNELLLATAKTRIGATILQAEDDQLAALGPPPKLQGDPDISLRLHESFINNMAAEALAGRTLDEEQVLDMLKQTMGKIPEHFKAEENEEPWSIKFAQIQPLVVSFDDGKFAIKISVDRFTRGDSDYPGMDITAHYKIEKSGNTYKGVRQGEVTILPPGFVIGKDKRLSVRQQAIRELIGRRFNKAFRKEITTEPLELPKKWKKLGKLPLSHWRTENGWTVVTWNLPQESRKKVEQKEPK